MEDLYSYQNKILQSITHNWKRAAFSTTDCNQRLFGIKGLSGVGKTTLMLQYLKYYYPEKDRALYVSADNPWFYDNNLYELIVEFDKIGGKLLLIDEIHKYPKWSSKLKAGWEKSILRRSFPGGRSAMSFRDIADLVRFSLFTCIPIKLRYLNGESWQTQENLSNLTPSIMYIIMATAMS